MNPLPVTPEKILQTGLAFWASKALLSAVEIGDFSELAHGPLSSDELGERLLLALTARAYRIRALNRAHPTLEDVFLAQYGDQPIAEIAGR